MSKINTKETKPKQIKSMIPKLLKTKISTNSKPVAPLISFIETITRKLEFEKRVNILNRGQNVL